MAFRTLTIISTEATAARGSTFKSASGQASAIKASLKRSVKEKVTSTNSWWGEKSPKSSGFANGVSGAMAAWAVKNTSPTSRGNQSMIGMGAGAVSNLPGASGLLYGLGGALGAASGGAQVIGGIAATFTGAGAAVGIPMILKGAVEVVVSVQVLSAAVKGEERKTGREVEEAKETEDVREPDDESDDIPEKAYDVSEQVKKNNGSPPKGYKGGRTYNNIPKEEGAQRLPEGVKYKEYDIHPYQKGSNRGTERIVMGNDGSVWYTNDHYFTFKQME